MSAVPKPARPATKPLASAPRKSSMNPIVLIGDSGFFTVIPGSLVSLAPRNDGLDGSTFTARDESIVSQTNFRRPSNKQGKHHGSNLSRLPRRMVGRMGVEEAAPAD